MMANQANTNSSTQNFAPDQTVQTSGTDGKWMYLQEASEATGLSEKTLRRYIKKRQLKSKRLGKQTNSPLQVWITPDVLESIGKEDPGLESIADILDIDDSEEYIEAETTVKSDESHSANTISAEVEYVIKTIAQQFADKLDQQKELIHELRNELQEKEIQLRLLPDLQKQLEEKEKMADFEKNALLKQIGELTQEKEQLRQEKEAVNIELAQPWWKKIF